MTDFQNWLRRSDFALWLENNLTEYTYIEGVISEELGIRVFQDGDIYTVAHIDFKGKSWDRRVLTGIDELASLLGQCVFNLQDKTWGCYDVHTNHELSKFSFAVKTVPAMYFEFNIPLTVPQCRTMKDALCALKVNFLVHENNHDGTVYGITIIHRDILDAPMHLKVKRILQGKSE